MGMDSHREKVLEWEESLDAWLIQHPTAMWDGHEIGCGEFRLYLLTPSPSDLLQEFRDRGTPLPAGTLAYTRTGPDGGEVPLTAP